MLRRIARALSPTGSPSPEPELARLRAERDQALAQVQALRAQLDQVGPAPGSTAAAPAPASGAGPVPLGALIPAQPMDPLPTDPADPRLRNWYHTIELAPGLITTHAAYDHRDTVDLVGLPASLAGQTVLDVGTADGFWAFTMEARGAERVVATDIAQMGQSDVVPSLRATLPRSWAGAPHFCARRFATVHAMRQSRVEYRHCSIYDLAPEVLGTFDFVYCGALLVHLFNPLQALIKIRSVTRGQALIETVGLQADEHASLEAPHPHVPLMRFANLAAEPDQVGQHCMYWYFSQKALCDMLRYAGFARAEPAGRFRTRGPGGGDLIVVSAIGHVA